MRSARIAFFGLFFCLAWGVAILPVERVRAEDRDVNPPATVVRLHLRGVRAVGRASSAGRQVDDSLRDVSAKLFQLPFSRFTTLSNEELVVPMHRKKTVAFAGNHTVTIRPIEAQDGGVCLWLSWKDDRGAKVLDTRVHLALGERMVAGTDSDSPTSGTIMVITAR